MMELQRTAVVLCAFIWAVCSYAFAQDLSPQKPDVHRERYAQASEAHYIKGLEHASEGKFEEAEKQFRIALDINEFHSDARKSLKMLEEFNQGKLERTYVLTTFMNRLLNVKLQKIEQRLGAVEKRIQPLTRQRENIDTKIHDVQLDIDRKLFRLERDIDEIERDIDLLEGRISR
ncbi:MAG: hypothetical protein JSW40_09675 [Candidatus Omnitrophota bacterium]|nr:MAG: hypothetical protein JSW40_09675 [Candidatus Omnitrophota bacterium]